MSESVQIARPDVLTALGQKTLRTLLRVWFDFERRLSQVPLIGRLERSTFTLEDYRSLLLHLRPQVVEGARWISRCASSFDSDFADVRSVVIGHASDEHRDYEIIEQDFVAAGGELALIKAQPKNPGSEALHSFLMHHASQPNPIDMLGAMWIIEGLGDKMAREWATRIEELTGLDGHTRFLRYHSENDDSHMDKLYGLLDRFCRTPLEADRIVMTATVVSRLYVMQLEEIDHA